MYIHVQLYIYIYIYRDIYIVVGIVHKFSTELYRYTGTADNNILVKIHTPPHRHKRRKPIHVCLRARGATGGFLEFRRQSLSFVMYLFPSEFGFIDCGPGNVPGGGGGGVGIAFLTDLACAWRRCSLSLSWRSNSFWFFTNCLFCDFAPLKFGAII